MGLLVLSLVAGIGWASYALLKKSRPSDEATRLALEAPDERTVATLQVGDVVQHLSTDYLVEGILTLSEEGRGSRLYRLADGRQDRYLYSPSGAEEPMLLEVASDLRLEGTAPETLEHAGQLFRLRNRASAAVIGVGTLGGRRVGERVRALLYAGVGPQRLLALEWNGSADAFVGERVPAHLLQFLPGH